MTTIVTRIVNPTGGTAKGLPLTSQEIDGNFISLTDNKLEAVTLNNNTIPASLTSIGVGVASSGVAGQIKATSDIWTTGGGLGVGTTASGTAGEIRATNQITSYYSDVRLKENIEPIENALEKVMVLRGVTYNSNKLAESFGFINKNRQVGVIAQDVEAVLPEAVKPAPFDNIQLQEGIEISKSGENYKTVQYEKIVPLLIEAIKELSIEIQQLKQINR
jgi:hypothetical protein